MGKPLAELTPEMLQWIHAQPLFFVATAPLAAEGHVNLSPKGLDCLRVLDGRRVAYLDLTGSGNETAAHVVENGRITLMLCSFSGPPRILRLQGRGTVVLPGAPDWGALRPLFPELPGVRQIVSVVVERIATSCGFGVPRMDTVAQRDTLLRWAEAKGEDGLAAYRREKNAVSIDGLSAPMAAKLAR